MKIIMQVTSMCVFLLYDRVVVFFKPVGQKNVGYCNQCVIHRSFPPGGIWESAARSSGKVGIGVCKTLICVFNLHFSSGKELD